MEQYPIPQFIEQEAKIAFFITFRQFFYLVGAGIACFFLYYLLPRTLFYLAAILIFGATCLLAFIKINNMTIVQLASNYIGFSGGIKNYVWKKKESAYPFKIKKSQKIEKIEEQPMLNPQKSMLKKVKKAVELNIKN